MVSPAAGWRGTVPVVVVYPAFDTVNTEYGVPVVETGTRSMPFLMVPTVEEPTVTVAPSTLAWITIYPFSLPGAAVVGSSVGASVITGLSVTLTVTVRPFAGAAGRVPVEVMYPLFSTRQVR